MPEKSVGDREITSFITEAKAKGASDEVVLRLLALKGWPEKQIHQGLGEYYERTIGIAAPARGGGGGAEARDAFLYLVSFTTLGIWSISLGALIFVFLDRWFPDLLATQNQPSFDYLVSNNLASVIVAFPVYLFTMHLILRDLKTSPEKRESAMRRWLTYIALFIAAGVVVGDLITFLAFFLRGELAVRFVLKVLTALVIAGSVFWYYLSSLKPGLRRGTHGPDA
ncbi:MAG: DUF5671 domain-containing protein [Acidobacteriota bacterium]